MNNNYWLNVYKPKNISSAALVNVVKKLLPSVKIGHCGTLDPDAEGVLPLAIGEATKLVRILIDARKTYVFTIEFGAQKDTGDDSGNVIRTTDHIPSATEVHEVCSKFIGTISQVPPIFSAIKVGGVRSYKLARQNKPVELKPRNVQIYDLECLGFDANLNRATYKVECSKGTYVRTLGEDIALSLQSLAFVVELRRAKVGVFTEENSVRLDQLKSESLERMENNPQDLSVHAIRIETILDDILVLEATKSQAMRIIYGQKCFFDYDPPEVDLLWIRYDSKILAIGSLSSNCFNSARVFNIINKKEIIDVDYTRT